MSGTLSSLRHVAALALVLLAALLGDPRLAGAQTAADSAWMTGDVELAERLYAARLDAEPSDELALHRLALMGAWRQHYGESLILFGRLLRISPDNLEARVDRARVLAWRGDLTPASEELDEVLEIDPTYLPALAERARVEAWAGNLEGAVSRQRALVEQTPHDRTAWRTLATYLAWAERLEEAIAIHEGLVRSDPSDRESRLGLATALAWSDQLDSAASVYDALLAEDPADAEALAGSARVAAWTGDLVEAESRWRRALELEPDDAAVLMGLGQTLRWQGRNAAARRTLQQAAALAPDDRDTKRELLLASRALSPSLGPAFRYESDSDANRILTGSLAFVAPVTGYVALGAELYGRSASIADTPVDAAAWGGLMELDATFEPGWSIAGGVGLSGADAPDAQAIVAVRGRVASPARHRFGGSIAFRRQALDESARLILNRVRLMAGDFQLRGELGRGWRLAGGASVGKYEGSEPNRRIGGHAAVIRSLSSSWRLGLNLNAFGFEKNLNDGYFDPPFYGIAEVRVEWRNRFGPVLAGLTAAPGVQQVGTEANARATGRGSGYAALEIGPGREIGVRAAYNATGLNSLATGDADYRYFSASLSASWAF